MLIFKIQIFTIIHLTNLAAQNTATAKLRMTKYHPKFKMACLYVAVRLFSSYRPVNTPLKYVLQTKSRRPYFKNNFTSAAVKA